jgi:hypothetical protein
MSSSLGHSSSSLSYISSSLGWFSSLNSYSSSSLGYISSPLGYISSSIGYISSSLGYISSSLLATPILVMLHHNLPFISLFCKSTLSFHPPSLSLLFPALSYFSFCEGNTCNTKCAKSPKYKIIKPGNGWYNMRQFSLDSFFQFSRACGIPQIIICIS